MSKNRWFAAMALACGAWVSVHSFCNAQEAAPAAAPKAAPAAVQYETIPLLEAIFKDGKETEATKKINRLAREVVNGQQPLAQNESSFDKYFTMYEFAKLTQTDDKSLARLPKDRAAFMRNWVTQVKRPDVHDHMVQLTFRSMKDIVTKNYHPAVRYNAMLIVGDLNSQEPVFTGSTSVPLPYGPALEFMMAQLRDPKQIDAVRVAALIGILRHADMNAYSQQQYPATVRQDLIKQMLPLVTDKKVPAERSEEGHAWLRGRAIEVVGALGQPAYEATVVQALWNIVGDTKESLDVRFTAAAALGRMDLRAGTTLSGEELARKLADLAVEASRQQLKLFDDEIAAEIQKQRLAGNTTTGRENRFGSTPREFYGEIPVTVVKTEQRLTVQQRLLKDRMLKTRLGLQGPEGKTGAITRATKGDYVKNVSAAVLALQKVADLKDAKAPERAPTINDLAKELRTQINDLERVAKTGGAPAPPPVAPPVAAEGPDEGPEAAPAPMNKKAPPAEGPEGPEEAPAPAPMPMAKKAPADEVPE